MIITLPYIISYLLSQDQEDIRFIPENEMISLQSDQIL